MNERFEGIILFKRLYREHDALVKIFTREYGTKMFFVKGLEKPNHPLLSQTIPLTKHQYIGNINEESLSFIKEGQTDSLFRTVQTDYMKQAYATYIAQLIDAATEDNHPNEHLYDLFTLALEWIDDGKSLDIVTTYMEIHLLPLFGTHLNWKQCVICGRQKEPFDFSVRLQGLLCQEHWLEDRYRLAVSPRAIHVAILLATSKLSNIQSVNVSQDTLAELRRLMDELYQEFVGIRLKSKSYLEQLTIMQESMNTMINKRKPKG